MTPRIYFDNHHDEVFTGWYVDVGTATIGPFDSESDARDYAEGLEA